jgi:hypothetical protein
VTYKRPHHVYISPRVSYIHISIYTLYRVAKYHDEKKKRRTSLHVRSKAE